MSIILFFLGQLVSSAQFETSAPNDPQMIMNTIRFKVTLYVFITAGRVCVLLPPSPKFQFRLVLQSAISKIIANFQLPIANNFNLNILLSKF